MNLDDFNALESEAADEPAFSNGAELSRWQQEHCSTCVHDEAARRGDYANACFLLVLGWAGFTPAQWQPGEDLNPASRYVCSERAEATA
ncbi:hypothetical protein [Embleya sp. NPDC001921]